MQIKEKKEAEQKIKWALMSSYNVEYWILIGQKVFINL